MAKIQNLYAVASDGTKITVTASAVGAVASDQMATNNVLGLVKTGDNTVQGQENGVDVSYLEINASGKGYVPTTDIKKYFEDASGTTSSDSKIPRYTHMVLTNVATGYGYHYIGWKDGEVQEKTGDNLLTTEIYYWKDQPTCYYIYAHDLSIDNYFFSFAPAKQLANDSATGETRWSPVIYYRDQTGQQQYIKISEILDGTLSDEWTLMSVESVYYNYIQDPLAELDVQTGGQLGKNDNPAAPGFLLMDTNSTKFTGSNGTVGYAYPVTQTYANDFVDSISKGTLNFNSFPVPIFQSHGEEFITYNMFGNMEIEDKWYITWYSQVFGDWSLPQAPNSSSTTTVTANRVILNDNSKAIVDISNMQHASTTQYGITQFDSNYYDDNGIPKLASYDYQGSAKVDKKEGVSSRNAYIYFYTIGDKQNYFATTERALNIDTWTAGSGPLYFTDQDITYLQFFYYRSATLSSNMVVGSDLQMTDWTSDSNGNYYKPKFIFSDLTGASDDVTEELDWSQVTAVEEKVLNIAEYEMMELGDSIAPEAFIKYGFTPTTYQHTDGKTYYVYKDEINYAFANKSLYQLCDYMLIDYATALYIAINYVTMMSLGSNLNYLVFDATSQFTSENPIIQTGITAHQSYMTKIDNRVILNDSGYAVVDMDTLQVKPVNVATSTTAGTLKISDTYTAYTTEGSYTAAPLLKNDNDVAYVEVLPAKNGVLGSVKANAKYTTYATLDSQTAAYLRVTDAGYGYVAVLPATTTVLGSIKVSSVKTYETNSTIGNTVAWVNMYTNNMAYVAIQPATNTSLGSVIVSAKYTAYSTEDSQTAAYLRINSAGKAYTPMLTETWTFTVLNDDDTETTVDKNVVLG